jgi:hypothetical protein
VETGISDASSVEILDGVSLGERVVVGPYRSLDQLKDGSKITFEGEDAKDKPAAGEGDAEPEEGEAHAQEDGDEANGDKTEDDSGDAKSDRQASPSSRSDRGRVAAGSSG